MIPFFLGAILVASDVWPGFRGAGDSLTDLPLEWGPDKNLAWSVELPGIGQSSPVVAKGRVFVTAVSGANKQNLHVVCLDLKTGRTLWTRDGKATQEVTDSDYVSKAAPTPCVDGHRVVAFFESGDLLAFDLDGKPLWTRSLTADYGKFVGNHGLGSSPAQTDAAVVLLVAHGGPGYLVAIDKTTGKNLWKTDLDLQTSWSSPAVATLAGKPTILISTNGLAAAFDPATGKEIWKLEGLKGNTVAGATPASEGLVVVGSSEPGFNLALRPTGGGKAEVVWRAEGVTGSFGSPLVHKGHAYIVNRAGVAVCVDAAKGDVLWTARLDASCWASPVGAGDRVYFFTTQGTGEVYRAGAAKVRLGGGKLAGTARIFGAAFVDGAILVRQPDRLTCIGSPK